MQHVARLLGGDRVVDRWRSNKHPKKVEAGDRQLDTHHLGRIQSFFDLSRLGDSQRRSTRAQHSNSQSCELRVALGLGLAGGRL
jgi:hypothetical protein